MLTSSHAKAHRSSQPPRSDLPPRRPAYVRRLSAVLFMMLVVEFVACSPRRRSTHGMFPWDGGFVWQGFGGGGVTDDEGRNYHLMTWIGEEAEEVRIVQIRARRETDRFDSLEDNATGEAIQAWRDGDFDCVEDNFAGESGAVCKSSTEDSAADQSQAAAWCNGRPKSPERSRSAANFVLLRENSAVDQSRAAACNGHLKSPERSAANFVSSLRAAANNVKTFQRIASVCEELRLNRREDYSVNRDVSCGWTKDATDDGHPDSDSAKEFSEQPCLDSVEEIPGQDDDDDSRIDQETACSSNESDISDSSTMSPSPLADAMVSSLSILIEQVDSSSDEMNSSITIQLVMSQMDIHDDVNMSTAERPLLTQPDSNDDTDVSSDKNSSEMLIEQLLVMSDDMDVPMEGEHLTSDSDDVPRWLLPGIKFAPTDLQIVVHYLKQKALNLPLPAYHPVVEGVNVHDLDADQITLDDNNRVDGEVLGFFFVLKERKRTYSNGCYHTTPDGYWRVRGRPTRVKDDGGRRTIAFRTSMDYYRGRPPYGCRTRWSMHEYALNADGRHADLRNLLQPWMNSYVVCKVSKRESKSDRAKKSSGLQPRRFRLKRRIQKRQAMKLKKAAAVAPAAARGEVNDAPACFTETLGKRKSVLECFRIVFFPFDLLN